MAIGNLSYYYYVDYYQGVDFRYKDSDECKGILEQNNKSLADFNPHTFMDQLDNQTIPHSFELQTEYPGLLVGTGIAHSFGGKGEAALGLALDYVTGMPYIPGSSVKGQLRSAFVHEDYIRALLNECEVANVNEIDIEELETKIFGVPLKDKKYEAKPSEQDIFYDAVVASKGKVLATDSITPHRMNKLLELAAPNPITMMRIRPGVKILFQFKLKEETCGVTAGQKLKLFKQILRDFGIGAKTNVGYGLLEECSADEQTNTSGKTAIANGICEICGKTTGFKKNGEPYPRCGICANKHKR